MAALTEQPPLPSTFDQDIDSFLNLDQLTYTAAELARSKTTVSSQPTLQQPEYVANSQSPVIFQGPSHQYDEHKQQTGLPPGALAQAMTYNPQGNAMGFPGAPSPGYPMTSSEMMPNPPMKREEPSLDFNTMPARNQTDMDLESDHSMGALHQGYYFSPNPAHKNQFVDPNALGGHDGMAMGPATQVGRMYPGMHQQQAAIARAAQQKQHEMLRQQQMQQQQQQQQQQQPQQHQPRRMEEPMSSNVQIQRGPNHVVDERISRLLQQLRQTAVSSPDDSPSPSMPQMAKLKKDEQEMDEDERLLASEEGKKLSSKERRQLRNKVSARAFRSRRKEYIGQLESEVAARTNEAHELRLQNRALYEENARLTDLARMLLSSPNAPQLLDESNAHGLAQVAQSVPQQSQPQPQQQPQQPQQPTMSQPPMQSSIPKETPQEFAMQQNSQLGMVMVPQQGLEVPPMGISNGGWNSGIDMSYANASVFAVTEVPETPSIDTDLLTLKDSTLASILPKASPRSKEAPVLESLPEVEVATEGDVGVANPDVEIDESDPAFALFLDAPSTSATNEAPALSFEGLRAEKETPKYQLIVEGEAQSAQNYLATFCLNMEAAFQRVSSVTSHL